MGPPSPIRAQGCDAVEVTHADDTPLTTAHDRWVDRDAAVVWHGFTQMSTYAENRPVIVESAEGRELIDVDGTRYLDAISSLWVTTLGHGVPELDAAAREQAVSAPTCSIPFDSMCFALRDTTIPAGPIPQSQ